MLPRNFSLEKPQQMKVSHRSHSFRSFGFKEDHQTNWTLNGELGIPAASRQFVVGLKNLLRIPKNLQILQNK